MRTNVALESVVFLASAAATKPPIEAAASAAPGVFSILADQSGASFVDGVESGNIPLPIARQPAVAVGHRSCRDRNYRFFTIPKGDRS
jgi:hypothetical protein